MNIFTAIILAWIVLVVTDHGVLVHSETALNKKMVCSYFVGKEIRTNEGTVWTKSRTSHDCSILQKFDD